MCFVCPSKPLSRTSKRPADSTEGAVKAARTSSICFNEWFFLVLWISEIFILFRENIVGCRTQEPTKAESLQVATAKASPTTGKRTGHACILSHWDKPSACSCAKAWFFFKWLARLLPSTVQPNPYLFDTILQNSFQEPALQFATVWQDSLWSPKPFGEATWARPATQDWHQCELLVMSNKFCIAGALPKQQHLCQCPAHHLPGLLSVSVDVPAFISCFAHIGGFSILLARYSSFDATWSQEWCRWRFLGKVERWWTTWRWAVLACQWLQQRRYRGMEKEEKRQEKTKKGQK